MAGFLNILEPFADDYHYFFERRLTDLLKNKTGILRRSTSGTLLTLRSKLWSMPTSLILLTNQALRPFRRKMKKQQSMPSERNGVFTKSSGLTTPRRLFGYRNTSQMKSWFF